MVFALSIARILNFFNEIFATERVGLVIAGTLLAVAAVALPLGTTYTQTAPYLDSQVVANRLNDEIERYHSDQTDACRDATVKVLVLGPDPVNPNWVSLSALLGNRRYVELPAPSSNGAPR